MYLRFFCAFFLSTLLTLDVIAMESRTGIEQSKGSSNSSKEKKEDFLSSRNKRLLEERKLALLDKQSNAKNSPKLTGGSGKAKFEEPGLLHKTYKYIASAFREKPSESYMEPEKTKVNLKEEEISLGLKDKIFGDKTKQDFKTEENLSDLEGDWQVIDAKEQVYSSRSETLEKNINESEQLAAFFDNELDEQEDFKVEEEGWKEQASTPLSAPKQWESFLDYNIRRRDVYKSPKAKGLIVVFVIHGTTLDFGLGGAGPNNLDYFDPKTQVYKSFKAFAKWYAKKHNKNLDLLSFRWPGTNLHEVRKNSAAFLRQYIDKNYSDNDDLGFIAHSHGCNVVNLLSMIINRPIKLLIYFACPVRNLEAAMKEKGFFEHAKDNAIDNVASPTKSILEAVDFMVDDYTPANFEKLVFFFSDNDWVAKAGAISKWSAAASVAVPIVVDVVVATGVDILIPQVKFIKVVANNKDKISSVIRWGVNTKSTVDSVSHLKGKADRANFFVNQKDKNMIGIKVQVNNVGPGHSDVPKVASVLPEIFNLLAKKYPHHAALNSYFAVNIDGETVEQHKNSMCFIILYRSVQQLESLSDELRLAIKDATLDQEKQISAEEESRFVHSTSACNVM